MMRLLLSAAIAAALPAAAFAVDYYVDNRTGSDKNDGRSPERAFATIGKATSRLKAGDTLNLAPGKYYESIHIRSSGTPEKPIVINGNGSVLCGLTRLEDSGWTSKGGDLYFFADKSAWGALRPKVYIGEERLISAGNKLPEDLKPMEASWQKDGVYFRAERGRKPGDYNLMASRQKGFTLHSGVYMAAQSYVVFNDITAERFANDGFNVHLCCHGLEFRNITGRWNGDDGFSVHEDVQATVYNGYFHHNDFGIQDVGIAQTYFFGCLVESNRLCGVDFFGGCRSMRDSTIRGNSGSQMRIFRGRGDKVQEDSRNPMLVPTVYLRNVEIGPGEGTGISVRETARLVAVDCSISGVAIGVDNVKDGDVNLTGVKFSNCSKLPVLSRSGGNLALNGCEGAQPPEKK